MANLRSVPYRIYRHSLKGIRLFTRGPDTRFKTPDLPGNLLHNCRVLSSRRELLGRLKAGAICAEIGVSSGNFSAAILEICKPLELHLIDAWKIRRYACGYERVINRFAKEIQDGSVIVHRGPSTGVLPMLPASRFDWVYLDSIHDYETTAAELELCARVVNADGRITGHDFCVGNPMRGRYFGVIKAVYEFCHRNNWEMEFITLDGNGYFSFCLKWQGSR